MPPIKSVAMGQFAQWHTVYNSPWSSKHPQCLEIPCLSLLGPAIHGRPQAAWDLNAQSNLDEFFAHLPFPSIGPALRRRNGFRPNRWSHKRLSLCLVGLRLTFFVRGWQNKMPLSNMMSFCMYRRPFESLFIVISCHSIVPSFSSEESMYRDAVLLSAHVKALPALRSTSCFNLGRENVKSHGCQPFSSNHEIPHGYETSWAARTWSKHPKPQPCTLPGNLIPNPLEDLYGEYSAKKRLVNDLGDSH